MRAPRASPQDPARGGAGLCATLSRPRDAQSPARRSVARATLSRPRRDRCGGSRPRELGDRWVARSARGTRDGAGPCPRAFGTGSLHRAGSREARARQVLAARGDHHPRTPANSTHADASLLGRNPMLAHFPTLDLRMVAAIMQGYSVPRPEVVGSFPVSEGVGPGVLRPPFEAIVGTMSRWILALAVTVPLGCFAGNDAAGGLDDDFMDDPLPPGQCQATACPDPTTGSPVGGPCLQTNDCAGDAICVADFAGGEAQAFTCQETCIPLEDDGFWCADDSACCEASAICSSRGYCVIGGVSLDGSSSGDSTGPGADSSSGPSTGSGTSTGDASETGTGSTGSASSTGSTG